MLMRVVGYLLFLAAPLAGLAYVYYVLAAPLLAR